MRQMRLVFDGVLRRHLEVSPETREALLEALLEAWTIEADRRSSLVQQELSACVVKLNEAYKTRRLVAVREAIRYLSLEARHRIDLLLLSKEEDEVLQD